MADVIETAHRHLAAQNHKPADRPVGRTVKGKGLGATGHRQGGPDHAAMHKYRQALIPMRRAQPKQRLPDPPVQRLCCLGAGDLAPFLAAPRLFKGRIVLRGLDPIQPIVPFAQMHLAQVRFDDRGQAKARRQRRRCLMGAPQAGDIDRINRRAGQVIRHRLRLAPPLGMQRRIAMPVLDGKRAPRHRRLGFAVPDQQHIAGPSRQHKAMLAVFFGHSAPLYIPKLKKPACIKAQARGNDKP